MAAADEPTIDLGRELFDLAETLNKATIDAATVTCLVEGLVIWCVEGSPTDLDCTDISNISIIVNGLRKRIKAAHEHLERVRPHDLAPLERVAEEE